MRKLPSHKPGPDIFSFPISPFYPSHVSYAEAALYREALFEDQFWHWLRGRGNKLRKLQLYRAMAMQLRAVLALSATLAHVVFGVQLAVNVSDAVKANTSTALVQHAGVTAPSLPDVLDLQPGDLRSSWRHAFRAEVGIFLTVVGSICAAFFIGEMFQFTLSTRIGRRAGQAVYVLGALMVTVGQGMLLTVSLPLAEYLGYSPAASGFLCSTTSLGALAAQAGMAYLVPATVLTNSSHDFLRRRAIASTFLQLMFHTLFVIALCVPLSDTARWYCLIVSRSFAGGFAGLSLLFGGFLAFAMTPGHEMLNLQTAVQGAYGVGQCLGNLVSSFALVLVHLTGSEKTEEALEAGAAPVMLFVLMLLFLLGILMLLVPRGSAQSAPEEKEAHRSPKNDAVASLVGSDRTALFRAGIVYNFERTFSVASIEVATTMISQVEFGFTPLITGWIFGAIAAGSFLANIIVACTPPDVDFRAILMLCFAFVGVATAPFLMNFWPWWSLYAADALMMTMTMAANGISDGLCILFATGEEGYSRQAFINQKMLSMAVAKVIAAPIARGLLPWMGRNGYASVQLLVTLAGFFGIHKMYRIISSRKR
ncbi:unnamed protein product [Symbiodinium natans]|uniref:Uncharacterized protein n=1 Tax=Symbiodinium natans TaxID=878477 RepID=A0A812IGM1_9DINO|nr:unnamed protein product [Symbiodinium natans]